MARLIPSFTDERTPPGERDVFNMLAAGPDDWVAIHSLDLAPWNRSLRTEIDFVVIVPDEGILCLEVKSHENISFDGVRWHPESIGRSPFKQALDGRHALYRGLAELAPEFRHVPIVHCCVFPRASFDALRTLSISPWELMDRRTFRKFPSGVALCADLKSRLQQSVSADGRLARLDRRLSPAQVESIVNRCIPVQRWGPDLREEIRRRGEEAEEKLLEQQKPVLRLANVNSRLIVSGAAGTGKTLIAMEVARRAAESGKRVALVCFNQLIGDWIKEEVSRSTPPLPNLVAGRAVRAMAELTGIKIPERPSRDFWDAELPQRLEERLTDPDFRSAASFDYLVVDEAQDILSRPQLWQCLAQFLDRGLARGAFVLFGDFDFQVLTERDRLNEALDALEASSRPAHWRLSENCRNYRIVGETAVRLAGLGGPVYSGYLRSGGSLANYDIFFYATEREQTDRLDGWLSEFKAQGYKASEITLLSFRSDESSAAAHLASSGRRLKPAWRGGDLTSYASVHAFKGMENKVIVLTDVTLGDRDSERNLFYTGMTRATESVRVLCKKDSQEHIAAWIAKGA